MSDLVKQLRVDSKYEETYGSCEMALLLCEAADRIERLEAFVGKVREAEIANVKLKYTIAGLVIQFADEDTDGQGRKRLGTGALSALEGAFQDLGLGYGPYCLKDDFDKVWDELVAKLKESGNW